VSTQRSLVVNGLHLLSDIMLCVFVCVCMDGWMVDGIECFRM